MVGPAATSSVEIAYRSGLFLAAWDALAKVSTAAWSARERTLEARLAHHLGAPRRSAQTVLANYRRRPTEGRARADVGYLVLEKRGPLAVLDWLRKRPLDDDGPDVRRDRFELTASSLIGLRDFTSARRVLDEWREVCGDDGERALSEVVLLAREDRMPEALARGREALEADPTSRRLTMMLASVLTSTGAPTEARDVLVRASATMESASIVQMLCSLCLGICDYEAARKAAEDLPRLLPLAEPDVLTSIAILRAEARYRCGDRDGALALVKDHDDPKTKRFTDRLVDRSSGDREKRLDVPFVMQEHLGCAPATLASIAKYFRRDADHLEVATRICYHGTPAHAERAWAESRGFTTREMTLTWESAVALLDREIPVAVSTFVPGSGHAQALMGYDERRRTFLLRDPSVPLPVEVDADEFLHSFRHCGPRCLVMVPSEQAERLEGVPLPDSALYDDLFAVESALARYDRKAASDACATLQGRARGHRIGRAARRAIAAYDENTIEVVAIAKEALDADRTDRLAELDVLLGSQALAPRAERVASLDRVANDPESPPIFTELLAAELAADAREHAHARRLSRRVLAAIPESARSIALLGQMAWTGGDAERGLELLRYAACLESTREDRIRQYAWAARKTSRFDDVIAFARALFAKLGARAAVPALFLADVLDETGDILGADGVLRTASELRPDDGDILLARARRSAASGDATRAKALFDAARGKVDDLAWARSRAAQSRIEGAPQEEQLGAWRAVLDAAPLAEDALAMVGLLVRRTAGAPAAIALLRSRVERFPHHRPTVKAHLAALREGSAVEREKALRAFLTNEPTDAWGHRELALLLSEARRHSECDAALDTAAKIDGRSVDLHLTRGIVAESRGDVPAAFRAFHDALDVDVDAELAIVRLVELCAAESRTNLVSEIFARLERSSVGDSALSTLYGAATPHVAPAWLDHALERFRTARPDLPAAWLLSIRQALAVGPTTRASALADEALARYPLVPEVHLEAAQVFSVIGARAHARSHLERAVELGPQLAMAVARLANLLEAGGERDAVDALLERAHRRASFDIAIALESLRIRVRRGDHERAIAIASDLLGRDPDIDAAWSLLSALVGTSDAAAKAVLDAAVRIARAHPGSDAAQAALAFLYVDLGRREDAIVTIQSALALSPSSLALRNAHATVLALGGDRQRALAACAQAPGEPRSNELAYRTAWVHATTGDLSSGIACLQRLLHEQPSLVSGWQQLSSWWLQAGNPGAALEAATRLVAIAPMTSMSQRTLARALLATNQRAAARVALVRALERDPRALDVAEMLFDAALEDRDLEAANVARGALVGALAAPQRLIFDVRFALHQNDAKQALAYFDAGCTDPTTPGPQLEAAFAALDAARSGLESRRIVDRAMKRKESNASLAALWAKEGVGRDGASFATSLLSLDAQSDVGRSAAVAVFEALLEPRHREGVAHVLPRIASWLRSDDTTWSAPIITLVSHRSFFAAARWGRDWTSRTGVAADRLHILAIAMFGLGLRRRGMEIVRTALPRATPAMAPTYRAWIAFDAAARGAFEEAATVLETIDPDALVPVGKHLTVLARSLVRIHATPRAERYRFFLSQLLAVEGTMREAAELRSLRDAFRRYRLRAALLLRRPHGLHVGSSMPNVGIAVCVMGVMSGLTAAKEHGASALILFGVLGAAVVTFLVGRLLWRAALARL